MAAIERPQFLRSARFETDPLKLVAQIRRDAAEFGSSHFQATDKRPW